MNVRSIHFNCVALRLTCFSKSIPVMVIVTGLTTVNKRVCRYLCEYGWSVGWRFIWTSNDSQEYQYRKRICSQGITPLIIPVTDVAAIRNCWNGFTHIFLVKFGFILVSKKVELLLSTCIFWYVIIDHDIVCHCETEPVAAYSCSEFFSVFVLLCHVSYFLVILLAASATGVVP